MRPVINQGRNTELGNKSSADKAMRQNVRRRTRNRVIRAKTRTEVKEAAKAIEGKDQAASEKTVREAMSALDKAAQKGIIKKNNAARRKSRLMKKLNTSKTPAK
jgi:small subunit ribosomal protein S20